MSLSQNTLDFYTTIRNTNSNISDFDINEVDITKNRTPQDFFRMVFLFILNHWDDILMVILTLSIVMIYISVYGITFNLNSEKKIVQNPKVRKIIYDGKANKVKTKQSNDNLNDSVVPDTSDFQYE